MVDVATLVPLLSDTVANRVFKVILKNRSALFREVVSSIGKNPEDISDRREVEAAVERLKNAELIKERTHEIEDFKSYYVTSDGLGVERRLRYDGIDI